jgi:hypothetical protein
MISARCSLGLSDEELSRWCDDDLNPTRMALIREHIATCAACRERLDAFEAIGVGLRGLEPPPLDLARLLADLHDTTSSAAATSTSTPARPLASAPHRSRRIATGAAGLAAVLVVSLLTGYLFVNHGRLAPAKVSAPPLTSADLPPRTAVIDMSSATDGWAFTSKSSNGDAPVVALHYSAGKWTRVQTVVQGEIDTLKMLSPTDGWLLGGTRIYHYDGHSWQIVAVPGPGWRLDMRYDALTTLAPSSIWISTDGTDVDPGPSMLHYDGNTWTRQALPMPEWLQQSSYQVQGISMASNDEGWAIASSVEGGSDGEPLGVLLHYTHGAWTIASTYIGVNLTSISLASATDGWIGGAYVTTRPMGNGGYAETFRPLLLRLSNGHWRIQTIPGGYQPPLSGQVWSIQMLSPTAGWMMADIRPAHETNTNTRPLFWLRNGQWVQVPDATIPDDLSEYFAAAFVSANEFWAIGRFGISHYSNGQWKLVVP